MAGAAADGFSPLGSIASFARDALGRRLHLPRDRVGTRVLLNGDEYTVFRELRRDPRGSPPAAAAVSEAGPRLDTLQDGGTDGDVANRGAVFLVRFYLDRTPPAWNRVVSLLPMPFFAGLPGLRSKLWLVNERTGEFAGLYEWETAAAAERYANSFAVRFVTWRAAPGSVRWKIESGRTVESCLEPAGAR